MSGFHGRIQAAEVNHTDAKAKLQYLLAVDRLDFYAQNLADFLDGKKSPQLIQALRNLKPEHYYSQRLNLKDLENTKAWQQLIFASLKQNNPTLSVALPDLEWNYDFFKNKMAARFGIKDAAVPKPGYQPESKLDPESQRSIPKIRGKKILLDTERYIAEKTSRAIFWDAILNQRDFAFYVGTQADFQEQIHKGGIELVTEVQPMANNYNKIYLTFNPKSGKYSYAMNLISGDDRIKHLSAQLRLIKFDGKSAFEQGQDKVRVFGSAAEFHKRQERILTDLFSQLPKADKIVIGQKGAIEDVIKNAGMMDVVGKESSQVVNGLNLPKNKVSKFENLIGKVNKESAFTTDSVAPGSMIDKAYALAKDPIQRSYKQFDSEQASHNFADYLLEDRNGKIQRWRVFSAIWGDEIIPIARALKNTGHNDVVYIGTAGAIANKGLKVGDVIAGDHVYTHSGKTLKFSEGKLVKNERPYGVGQVYTPFDETDKWLSEKGPMIDAVEVETGYLREQLAANARLEAYFLISDVVGSESETLAHAAQSASKRKRGQLRLLENLFVQNGIVAPVSNFEILPMNNALRGTYEKLKVLRPSREEFSLMQIAQLAAREGKTSTADLEALLKSQPTFTRTELSNAILSLGGLIAEIENKLGKNVQVGIFSESLFAGTFNPKVKTSIQLLVPGLSSKTELAAKIGADQWKRFEQALSKHFDISIMTEADPKARIAKSFKVSDAQDFYRSFENMVLKPAGLTAEIDKNGSYRARPLPGVDGPARIRCELVLQ
ncbi:hypothetical protein [Bdellovibrio sp. HCB337]|uniref:hypothetical protein n=1 Tax=Bdellovibrio sp. HCB337 TaxID=3394358 RepID=UPI0039A717FF